MPGYKGALKHLLWQILRSFDPAPHRIGRSLMLRGLGLVYLVAITSWWTQAALLVGENGLVPASRLLEFVGGRLAEEGKAAFPALPTLFWFIGASDFALHAVCGVGCVLATLVVARRFTGPALAGLWAIYLSLVNTGGVFMSFQWDILLLEAGFLALFLCPWGANMSWRNPPPLTPVNRVALVFAWFLIAKLMFLSGWVKLAWASPASPEWWPDGTAMTYHYMTQPLPTWMAWWMHQLPAGFHKLSLVPMHLVEIVLPFAVLFGRWGRLVAAAGFAGLMGLILLTGNYTYFNWLAIVLCLPLVQDRLWPGRLRRMLRIDSRDGKEGRKGVTAFRYALAGPPLLALALLNLHTVLRDLHAAPKPLLKRDLAPHWLDRFAGALSPFHLASGYGLFRTMKTERPEIVVEGSADGTGWLAYDFAWKVDGIDERPRFVAPHQPRVAWQLWFAALEGRFDYRSRNAAWFEALVWKLLRGEPGVKRLLRHDPFPDSPPRLVRARLMRYEFTTLEERRASGDWWKRVVIGEYLPEVALPATKP